ncbi:MAG: UDP-N-acetylmuramate dehydrogenase [Acidobacteriota bacterium]
MPETSFAPDENVPLAPLTTFGIGGPARFFVRAENLGILQEALQFARSNEKPIFILGGGSNILVSDRGFGGIVIQIAFRGIEPANETAETICLQVGAGEEWDAFAAYCVERDYAGVECLSGIPGSVGGTPIQNVGAYGQEVSETIVSVDVYDRASGTIVKLLNSECGLAYRTSIFNTITRDRYIVLSVQFRLVKGGAANIRYRDLADQFDGRTPSLAETREAVLNVRRSKSMVIDPDDPNSRSAGSFFKNPIVSKEAFDDISARFTNVPGFKVDGSQIKIPAAWIIENAGFPKGYVGGNAGISNNHTLAIINRNGATAVEIIALKNKIENAVFAMFGICLTPEPIFVGFDAD